MFIVNKLLWVQTTRTGLKFAYSNVLLMTYKFYLFKNIL